MDFGKLLSSYSRIIVELGMGDGKLLENLAKVDPVSLYLGIELKSQLCDQARSRIALDNNLLIMNGSFEKVIREFPDASVDRFICVLPDPAYIDEKRQQKWVPFYRLVHVKLKNSGTFQLITELTNDLLQPVSPSEYSRWASWLNATFSSIGFIILNQYEGAPIGYFSRCLDQFRGDTERIRITTLEMGKF